MTTALSQNPVRRAGLPAWVIISLLASILVNAFASVSTFFTIELMGNVSPFALEVRAHEREIIPIFNAVA